MNQIETKILNCSAIQEAEKNMVFAARLTQRDMLSTVWRIFSNYTISLIELIP